MKIRNRISSFIIFVFFLGLTSCAPLTGSKIFQPEETLPVFTALPSATSTPKPSPSFTPKPTLFTMPSPTPYPTLPSDKSLQLLKVLHDESCRLPCFLGIVPGETLIPDANEILLRLGGSYLGEYVRKTDSALSHTYKFKIGDQNSGETLITHTVTLITDNETVQAIIVGGGTLVPKASSEAIKTYRTYWQRYSAKGIFDQLDKPERLSVNSIYDGEYGSFLVMLYSKENIAINIYGTREENNLCPKKEATYLTLDMYLSYPGATVSINDSREVSLYDQEIYPPIEDVYNVTTKEFYNGVLSNPSVCWEPKENSDN